MTEQITQGDVVRLTNGGPKMTVEGLAEERQAGEGGLV